MKTKKIKVFDQDPDTGVSNYYPTPNNQFHQPCLQYIQGVRNSGKSYLCSKMLAQFKKDKTFDRVYLVSPSFHSNKSYFGKYINEEDTFEPTRDSIQNVINLVEADRDEFEEYLAKMELYKKFKREMKSKIPVEKMNADILLTAYENNFFTQPPKWKYNKVEPPKSLLILDDVLGSPAVLQSSGLMKLATLNRHTAPLQEPHSNRSACGLACIILSQSYRMGHMGIGRVLRENLSLLTLFKNKQEKQIEAIEEELGSVVDIDLFRRAYNYATAEKHGSLTIDFNVKCPSRTFRKNLNELIMFDELPCQCKNKKDKK
jgi:hypothetical protein|tara:strand:+ start:862 stop:1809 length:948 start_codon:yes stop_codon:yes gene_type:complete